jgi:hypothetical protein
MLTTNRRDPPLPTGAPQKRPFAPGFSLGSSKKESDMTDTAPTNDNALDFPSITGLWTLTVSGVQVLEAMQELNIVYQGPIAAGLELYGSVNSAKPTTTAYAMELATVGDNDQISFQIEIEGVIYYFNGQVDGANSMSGTVSGKSLPTAQEDGSWSAQGQGSGDPR